jgi:hypothetical protein
MTLAFLLLAVITMIITLSLVTNYSSKGKNQEEEIAENQEIFFEVPQEIEEQMNSLPDPPAELSIPQDIFIPSPTEVSPVEVKKSTRSVGPKTTKAGSTKKSTPKKTSVKGKSSKTKKSGE